jgi:hypothetical protein
VLEKLRRLLLSDIFLSFSGNTAYAAAQGQVFAVPARLLVELPGYRIVALGEEAREVEHAGLGRSKVITPCDETEVFDERGVEVFLRGLFRIVLGTGFLLKPRVWLSLPTRATPFMKEVWTSALLGAGAREVYLAHPLLAVAAGAGLPYQSSHGYAVGEVEEGGVSFGLVAFGHVQQEVWRPFPPGSANDEAARFATFRQAWEELLGQISPEFLGSLLREGGALAVPDDSVEWARAYAQELGVPAVLIDRAAKIAGLRHLAKEGNE